MSDRVPLFKFGDRVRILQMAGPGLANRLGTVMERQRTPSHYVRVALDETDTIPEVNVELPAASLIARSPDDH